MSVGDKLPELVVELTPTQIIEGALAFARIHRAVCGPLGSSAAELNTIKVLFSYLDAGFGLLIFHLILALFGELDRRNFFALNGAINVVLDQLFMVIHELLELVHLGESLILSLAFVRCHFLCGGILYELLTFGVNLRELFASCFVIEHELFPLLNFGRYEALFPDTLSGL